MGIKYRKNSRCWLEEVKSIKAAVRDRDGRCVDCGISRDDHKTEHGKDLHVHRLNPGSDYTVDGCVALCFQCHGRRPEHRSRSEIKACSDPKPKRLKAIRCKVPVEVYDKLIKDSLAKGRSFDDEVYRLILLAAGVVGNR